MKTLRAVCLSLMLLSFLVPPQPAHAQGTPETFSLPNAQPGDPYRVNIVSVLQDKYGLRIDTGAQSSILQWLYVDGEMPPGTSVFSDGTIAGTPTISLDRAYRFRVKVIDVAMSSAPLFLDVNIMVEPQRIKLTKMSEPKLVPIERLVSTNAYTGIRRTAVQANIDTPIVAYDVPDLSVRYDWSPLARTRPSSPTTAMTDDSDSSKVSRLFRRSRGGTRSIVINMPATSVPKPVEVTNETKVTITGSKKEVDTCVVATKREELKPEPNPLVNLLKVIIGFGAFTLAEVTDVDSFCMPDPPSGEVPGDPEAAQVEREITSIRKSLFRNIKRVEQAHTEYQGMAKRVKNFVSCKTMDGTNICGVGVFDGEKDNLKAAVRQLLDKKLPALESTDLQLATLKKVLADRYKKPTDDSGEQWLQKVNTRLDCFSQNFESVKKDRESLAISRIDLEKFYDLLEAHQTKVDYTQLLLADANAKVSGTVTCTNFFTKQVSAEVVPFTVTYQDLPRANVSAGILFSLLDKRQIGIQPVRTGTAADGTPTFRLQFSESDRGSSQVVPFSFFNYYLTGTRQLNLNLSGGVGLNPNNGSNQVEYFVGGALGLKNIFLHFGGHVGKWQELGNGFVIGDVVPDKFPATAPLERRYSLRPAFGLSYRLPLP